MEREYRKGVSALALFCPRFQFVVEESDDAGLATQAQERLAHHVGTEEREEIEILAGLEKRFGELDGVLKIDVVVGESMNDEERPAQACYVSQDVAGAITFRVFQGQTEI